MIGDLSVEQLQPNHLLSVSRDSSKTTRSGRNHRSFPSVSDDPRKQQKKYVAAAPKSRYYAAFLGGAAVGLAMLRGWEEGYEVPSFGMFIDHRYHGRGIGRRLIELAIYEAARLGCAMVRLTVYESNSRGHGLYASLGFQEHSREPAERCGARDNRIVMVRAPDALAPAAANHFRRCVLLVHRGQGAVGRQIHTDRTQRICYR